MTIHSMRNREAAEQAIFELRETLRGRKWTRMPQSTDGFVVEDLDVVLRWFGPSFGLDDLGRSRPLEFKHLLFGGGLTAKTHIWRNLGLDRPGERSDGLFVVYHSDDNHDEETIYILNNRNGPEYGGVQLTAKEFIEWCLTPFSPYSHYFHNRP